MATLLTLTTYSSSLPTSRLAMILSRYQYGFKCASNGVDQPAGQHWHQSHVLWCTSMQWLLDSFWARYHHPSRSCPECWSRSCVFSEAPTFFEKLWSLINQNIDRDWLMLISRPLWGICCHLSQSKCHSSVSAQYWGEYWAKSLQEDPSSSEFENQG